MHRKVQLQIVPGAESAELRNQEASRALRARLDRENNLSGWISSRLTDLLSKMERDAWLLTMEHVSSRRIIQINTNCPRAVLLSSTSCQLLKSLPLMWNQLTLTSKTLYMSASTISSRYTEESIAAAKVPQQICHLTPALSLRGHQID